jgi:hypothetical protein
MVHPGHLSTTTRDILERRDRGARGSSFYRSGDAMVPLMREFHFPVTLFNKVYDRDHARVEAALPLDLLFLHQVAVRNGHDDLVISPHVPQDERLPWYGEGDMIVEMGTMLDREAPKIATRKPRHLEDATPIEAIAPRQIRMRLLDVTLPDPYPADPEMDANDQMPEP